jgi:hypothetical protein
MRKIVPAAAVFAAAILAACGGTSPPAETIGGSLSSDWVRTVAHFVQRPVHPDRGRSWMDPAYGAAGAHTRKSRLLYVDDDSTNDVYVYDYKSGKQVGQLTGFDGPYGMCVDAKGDVYTANFDAGTVVEYAHGGTTAINTYSSGGEPIGCAVDATGDLAVTSFDPGDVTVYTGGNPSEPITYSNANCEVTWALAYDDKENLVGIAKSSLDGVVICAVLAGSKSMQTLQLKGKFSLDFPGGTTWDGKYFALGDQEVNGVFQSGLIQARLRGTTLREVGQTILSDNCESDYVDVVNPFVLGEKNTPVNNRQGTVVLGPNLWCVDAGKGAVDYWHYPAGGLPFKRLPSPPANPYGAAVSIGT